MSFEKIQEFVGMIRDELAGIERDIANRGAAALDGVRARLKKVEGHTDGIHAAAEVSPVPLADEPRAPIAMPFPEAAPTPQAAAAMAASGISPASSVSSSV